MSRSTSATFREAIYAQQTGEAFLLLIELNHASLSNPLRVGSDAVDTDHYYSIRSASYQWTLSGSGTNEYYLEASGGGDPEIDQPDDVLENDVAMSAGTVGSLSAGEWDWGDNDSLGFDTVYVRLSDSTDPDGKAADYVKARETYVAYPFDIHLPDDPERGVSVGKLVIDNIAREIVQAVRSITTAPTLNVKVVLGSDPDTVEAEFTGFELVNVDYDVMTVAGDIGLQSFANEPFPGDSFLPSKFPGLF